MTAKLQTMDIRAALLSEHSKFQITKITKYIGKDSKRFEELFTLFLYGENRIVQRASWAINYCVENHPGLIQSYYPNICKILKGNPSDTVKRNIVRMLQYVEIPEEWQGHFYDICFTYVSTIKEPVAVRAFSMQVLYNIAKNIPELKSELIELLSDTSDSDKPGIRSRSKNILAKLTF